MHNEFYAREFLGFPTKTDTILMENIKAEKEMYGEDAHIPEQVTRMLKTGGRIA